MQKDSLRNGSLTIPLIQAKLEAEERVIQNLQSRLDPDPQNNHLLFLLEIHLKKRSELQNQLIGATPNKGAHFEDVVDKYMSQMNGVSEGAPSFGCPEKEQELKTWEALLEKVKLRLAKRPGDPLLINLCQEHSSRIEALKKGLGIPFSVPTSEKQLSFEPSPRDLVESNSEKISEAEPSSELEVWQGLLAKLQLRLAKKPELTHLKGMIAEYEQKIRDLN